MTEEQSTLSTQQEGLPEEEFSKLLQSVSTMAPLLKGFLSPKADQSHGVHDEQNRHEPPFHGGRDSCLRREALLLALKPYLSKERCAAVDYLIRLARVGDAIRALQ